MKKEADYKVDDIVTIQSEEESVVSALGKVKRVNYKSGNMKVEVVGLPWITVNPNGQQNIFLPGNTIDLDFFHTKVLKVYTGLKSYPRKPQ